MIRTKGTATEPPKLISLGKNLNAVQTMYLDILTEEYGPACGFDWRNGIYTLRGAREDDLKARQEGLSTLWLALFFAQTINTPLTQTVILTDDGARSETLFRIIHRFYKGLSKDKQRPTKYSSKREIEFEDIDSIIAVGTAGSDNVGRGGTVNNLLLSERAFYTDGNETETGILPSIPAGGNVVRETTANGFNEYHIERELEHNGKSVFKPRFFPWYIMPEYRSSVPADFEKTKEEERLAATYELDDEQLVWRRQQATIYKEKMPQEYPTTEREAFIATGNPIFDREMLTIWEQRQKRVQEIAKPLFETRTDRRRLWQRLRTLHNEGYLKVWEEPDEDLFYLVSADPAGGVKRNKQSNFCSASVWAFGHFRPFEQVCHVHGLWEPHEFAWILAEMAFWYNEAMLCPLKLNHGESVWNTLVHEVHYPQNRGNGWGGLYYHNPAEVNEKADDLNPEQRLPGWPEGGGGKAFAVEMTQKYVSEDAMIINSRTTLTQMFQYVHLPGGGMGGENGTFDDCVSDVYCGVAVYHLRGKHAAHARRAERLAPPTTYGGYGNVYGRK
jgi:hypothetical protein